MRIYRLYQSLVGSDAKRRKHILLRTLGLLIPPQPLIMDKRFLFHVPQPPCPFKCLLSL